MSEITGNPVWDFTSARMSRPSSSPGPRNESLEERLALSKEDLKTMRARVSSPITFSLAAILRLWARDSMTHGPAKKRGSFPPPISYPGAIETVRESITRQDIGPPARSEALRPLPSAMRDCRCPAAPTGSEPAAPPARRDAHGRHG